MMDAPTYVQANYDCKCGYRFYLIGSHVELPAVCPRCHQEVDMAYWWENVPESEANPPQVESLRHPRHSRA